MVASGSVWCPTAESVADVAFCFITKKLDGPSPVTAHPEAKVCG
jgi:hypothetical protein